MKAVNKNKFYPKKWLKVIIILTPLFFSADPVLAQEQSSTTTETSDFFQSVIGKFQDWGEKVGEGLKEKGEFYWQELKNESGNYLENQENKAKEEIQKEMGKQEQKAKHWLWQAAKNKFQQGIEKAGGFFRGFWEQLKNSVKTSKEIK